MATKPAAIPIAGPEPGVVARRIDLDAYNEMVACGALEGRRIELLHGAIEQMSPKPPAHVVVVTRLMRHFATATQWWTQVQDPIEVPPNSEPEPDLAVFAGEPPAGKHHHTALLVVEVAVSSQLTDRNVKPGLYAQAAIPTY